MKMSNIKKAMIPALAVLLQLSVSYADTPVRPRIDLLKPDWSIIMDVINNSPARPAEARKRSEYPNRFTVAEFDGKRITNRDLEQFIQHSTLADANMLQLYHEKNQDWHDYTEAKDDLVYKEWRESLKKFLYYKIMEKEAQRAGANRPYFTTSRDKYFRMCDDSEHDILKTLLDEGKGIVYAREKFADFLIEQGYPHEAGESRMDIYLRWLNLNNGRIRESIRRAEVERMEHILAHPRAKRDYFPNIGQMHNIFHQSLSKTQALFAKATLTSSEINNYFRQNADARLSVAKIDSMSLDHSSLSKINAWDRARFNQEHRRLATELQQQLTATKLQSLPQHLNTVALFRQRYQASELETREKSALDAFVLADQGNYQHLFLSKLYKLASQDASDMGAADLARLLERAQAARLRLIQNAQSAEFFLRPEAAEFNSADYLFAQYHQMLVGGRSSITAYETALIDFLSWMVKFEIKKIALRAPVYFIPSFRSYQNSETQRMVENFQVETEFQNQLSSIRQRLKQRYRHYLRINPEGSGFWNESESIGFVFPR